MRKNWVRGQAGGPCAFQRYAVSMPVYEFRCQACRTKFSWLVGMTAEQDDAKCPNCGSTDARRVVSRFQRVRSEDERMDELMDRFENHGEPESPAEMRKLVREMGKAMDEDMSDELEEMLEEDLSDEGGDGGDWGDDD